MQYQPVSDSKALEAFKNLVKYEEIIPALESSHAVSLATDLAKEMSHDESIAVTLSGRGDKDLTYLMNKGVI